MKTFYKLNPLQLGSGTVIPGGFTGYTLGKEPKKLLDAKFPELKEAKVNEIKFAFNIALKEGYACSNSIKMDANLFDILALKAGYNLAVALSQATMDITDYNNIDHTGLVIADVFKMITELGVNYNTLRVKKNNLRTQTKQATTQAKLDVIVW